MALHYCHKTAKIIHRDIKPDNIMLNHKNQAVLIDFGISAIVEKPEDVIMETSKGSYYIYAPEMFNISDGA